MNFVHGYPHVCISIGLVINKVIEYGIIYNPVLEQRFTAEKGKGAFYNCRQINVSDTKGKNHSFGKQHSQACIKMTRRACQKGCSLFLFSHANRAIFIVLQTQKMLT